jgi:hypothetical protein
MQLGVDSSTKRCKFDDASEDGCLSMVAEFELQRRFRKRFLCIGTIQGNGHDITLVVLKVIVLLKKILSETIGLSVQWEETCFELLK